MPSYYSYKLTCLCCGLEWLNTQFPVGSDLCKRCVTELSPSQIFIKGREFGVRKLKYRAQARAGRKSVRVEQRMAEHAAAGGKRCCECHARKPATPEFWGTANTRADRMQPACRSCISMRASLRHRPGGPIGLELWRTLRTALRMRNEPAAPAASAPAAVTQQPLTEPGRIPG